MRDTEEPCSFYFSSFYPGPLVIWGNSEKLIHMVLVTIYRTEDGPVSLPIPRVMGKPQRRCTHSAKNDSFETILRCMCLHAWMGYRLWQAPSFTLDECCKCSGEPGISSPLGSGLWGMGLGGLNLGDNWVNGEGPRSCLCSQQQSIEKDGYTHRWGQGLVLWLGESGQCPI